MQKQREKEEQEKLDKKMFVENSNYNPYGRAGGGAPIRDRSGNVVADLAHIKADPSQFSPREALPPNSFAPSFSQPANNYGPPSNNYGQNQQYGLNNNVNKGHQNQSNDNLMQQFGFNNSPPNTNKFPGEDGQPQSFARGGNGIFGEGKVKF